MKRASLSRAAAQLLRSLVARTGLAANRISVGRLHSVDWQSLTFTGERHEISLTLTGPGVASGLARLRTEMSNAEWQLEGHVVADVLTVGEKVLADGSIMVEIEALTLSE